MKQIVKSNWPIELEPKNSTMNKKLCITVCPQGAVMTRDQNPNQPYTPKEVANQAIAAYKEGASIFHFHARSREGWVLDDIDSYIETIEIVLNECPDMIMCPSISIRPKMTDVGLYELATTQPLIDALLKRGRRYIETTVVVPCSYISPRPLKPGENAPLSAMTREKLRSEIEFLQKKGIKPEFIGHSFEAIENVINYVIKPGVLKKPYFISLGPAMHSPSASMIFGNDPWGYLYLITMKSSLPSNSVMGLSAGGHNWLTLTTMGIMLGLDVVRVGMEDTMWLYPHKDDIIKSSAQVTKKIANIAKELGREIATPSEAREILGLKE
jgi:3-keto-5-aminohexanoate cleavage enzyme